MGSLWRCWLQQASERSQPHCRLRYCAARADWALCRPLLPVARSLMTSRTSSPPTCPRCEPGGFILFPQLQLQMAGLWVPGRCSCATPTDSRLHSPPLTALLTTCHHRFPAGQEGQGRL